MAAGILTLLAWLMLGYNAGIHEVFPALGVSTSVYVLLAKVSEQRVDLAQLIAALIASRIVCLFKCTALVTRSQ